MKLHTSTILPHLGRMPRLHHALRAHGLLPWLSLLLLGAWLGACSSGGYDLKQIGPKPGDHQGLLKAYLEEEVFGQGAIQSLSVAEPNLGVLGLDQGWLICYRIKARQPAGGVTGLQQRAILVRQGKIHTTVNREFRSTNCGKKYAPVIGGK